MNGYKFNVPLLYKQPLLNICLVIIFVILFNQGNINVISCSIRLPIYYKSDFALFIILSTPSYLIIGVIQLKACSPPPFFFCVCVIHLDINVTVVSSSNVFT